MIPGQALSTTRSQAPLEGREKLPVEKPIPEWPRAGERLRFPLEHRPPSEDGCGTGNPGKRSHSHVLMISFNYSRQDFRRNNVFRHMALQ